jgi:hypothetical protein
MYIIYIVFSRSVSRMMWRVVMEKQVEVVIADLCILELGKGAPDSWEGRVHELSALSRREAIKDSR